jgi:hypothetical protein
MAQALEDTESRHAPWVTRLVIASVVLAILTFLLSLFDGMVGKALPLGIASLVLAVVAVLMAQSLNAHRGAALAALVIGGIALASGLQSALLGTGQIN